MRKWFCGICGLLLCLALTSTVWGQAEITTGTVQGDVADEKGGTVPGATVEIKNLDTNYSRTQTTTAEGHHFAGHDEGVGDFGADRGDGHARN